MSFSTLGLSAPLVAAVTAQGYQTPSPIQLQAIPAILQGRDVMAAAQTGTGKTAGFTLPLLERLQQGRPASNRQVRALILTPTRELAAQVADSVSNYGAGLKLRYDVVFGGVGIRPQIQRLQAGADVLVATPGRLLDLYNQQVLTFERLEVLVLDEADRMLDMGFIHDIRKILKLLPAKRQNLMFSATFSDDIRRLAATLVHDPLEISVAPRNSTATRVEQWVYPVDKKQKPALLKHLLDEQGWSQVLVFSRTKHGADRLSRYLEKNGVKSAAIHGNKAQGARTRALAGFKNGNLRVLVATDIAARGLDIDQLPQVVNVDLPDVPEDYVHRIGRTGRAGASGQAASLVCAEESKQLQAIERLIGQTLPRKTIPDFVPEQALPSSKTQTPRNNKPARPKADDGSDAPKRRRNRNRGSGKRPASAKPVAAKNQNRRVRQA
ncbi:MAG: DEAD/DEAH box helicase [Thiolinea sp.]